MYINYCEVSISIVFFFLDWVFPIVFVKSAHLHVIIMNKTATDEQMNSINETNPNKSRQVVFVMGTKG